MSLKEEQRPGNTGLAKVAVQCSADTFVVKIATFAKPETVIGHYNTDNGLLEDIFQISLFKAKFIPKWLFGEASYCTKKRFWKIHYGRRPFIELR